MTKPAGELLSVRVQRNERSVHDDVADRFQIQGARLPDAVLAFSGVEAPERS